jgi:hypothetical protein
VIVSVGEMYSIIYSRDIQGAPALKCLIDPFGHINQILIYHWFSFVFDVQQVSLIGISCVGIW